MASSLIVSPSSVSPILVASTKPEETGITVGQLCEQFIYSKKVLLESDEITARMIRHYERSCNLLIESFGYNTPVEWLRAIHFTQLKQSFPKTWGAAKRGSEIQHIRTLFRFAYESELIDKPMRFGPDFKKPKLLVYRRERRLKGLQMFEAEEIREMLTTLHHHIKKPSHPWALRAMILLGINCGFGPADCGRLRFSMLDLENGWVSFPRPKTETDRKCALWLETVEAIKRSLLERPKEAKNPEDNDRVFLTKYGKPWCDGEESSALTKRFKWLMKKAGVRRKFRGFYGLRRSFRTIADETNDSGACALIMGHVPPANDMAAVYVQRIADDRLRKVAAHVRSWLFPGDPLDWDDPSYQKAAQRLCAEWDAAPRLTGDMVRRACRMLGITQFELARGTGLHPQWLSVVILGKRPMSNETELKIRLYVQQVADGKTPKPLQKVAPQYHDPKDIPLSDEAVEALSHDPITRADIAALADCLAQFGITQIRLAQWWGFTYKFYWKMRCGSKAIPKKAMPRLRALFGVEGGAKPS